MSQVCKHGDYAQACAQCHYDAQNGECICDTCRLIRKDCQQHDDLCITHHPEPAVYTELPRDVIMYVSLIRYSQAGAGWTTGPSGTDLAEVERLLRAYKTIDAARIYHIRVPI